MIHALQLLTTRIADTHSRSVRHFFLFLKAQLQEYIAELLDEQDKLRQEHKDEKKKQVCGGVKAIDFSL